MPGKFNVAVVGATGVVGETMLEILGERDFPVDTVYPLASERSVGKTASYRRRDVAVQDLANFDFSTAHIAMFSAGGAVSAEFAPKAAAAGCVVIDNTSHFRYDDDIPLVVPEVNPEAIGEYRKRGIIANPNCSTIQMVTALKPIYDAVGIERINVATYQAVSGAGRSAVEELARQTTMMLNGRPLDLDESARQIAFNAIPQIDTFEDNGYTREEMKMLWETQKIFGDKGVLVNATAVRIPVFFGHSEAVHIETGREIAVEDVRKLLAAAPGVTLVDDPATATWPTAVTHSSGKDSVFVGRVRRDLSHPRGIDLWVVSDNVRKGAALNSVQIAEILVKNHL